MFCSYFIWIRSGVQIRKILYLQVLCKRYFLDIFDFHLQSFGVSTFYRTCSEVIQIFDEYVQNSFLINIWLIFLMKKILIYLFFPFNKPKSFYLFLFLRIVFLILILQGIGFRLFSFRYGKCSMYFNAYSESSLNLFCSIGWHINQIYQISELALF